MAEAIRDAPDLQNALLGVNSAEEVDSLDIALFVALLNDINAQQPQNEAASAANTAEPLLTAEDVRRILVRDVLMLD